MAGQSSKMQGEPGLVSLITPTYNRAHFIQETIDSVLAQTYREFEHVIVDDGSTDDTEQIVRAIQAREGRERIVYVRQEREGACVARNKGIALSRGAYVKFLDSDDVLTPNALEIQVHAIEETRADVVYGDWRLLHTDGAGASKLSAPITRPLPEDMVEAYLLGQWIPVFCQLLSRPVVVGSRGWDPELAVHQDIDFFVGIAIEGATYHRAAHVAGHYRQDCEPSVSSGVGPENIAAHERIFARAEKRLRGLGELNPRRARALAHACFRLGRSKLALSGDWPYFYERLEEARRIFPGFRPPRLSYRLLAALLGYKGAEWVIGLRRRIFAG